MKLIKLLLAMTVFLLSTQVFAEVESGKDYKELSPALPTHTGEKIEVLEFFFYGCSHCFHLHPLLSTWEKKMPKDVEPKVGMVLEMQDEKGTAFPATVAEVGDKTVKLNFNHPLAGKELKFDVKVVAIE